MMHSNGHGSCNAIFSSSPINFNKENQPPEKIVLASFPNLSGDERIDTKIEMNANNGQSPLTRSKSASTLQRNDSSQLLRSNNFLGTPSRINSKNSRVSGRTPVTHFCTPERPSALGNDNVRSKTPIKRYFSDHVLSQATPECFNVVTMETPKRKQETRLEEQTVCEGENSNLTVGVRVRPLSFKELNDPKIAMIVNVEGQSISVECESSEHTFTYDHCFMSYPDPETPGHANQQTIFDQMVLPLVQNAFQGYNVCLFAYGQTGSGKSHSMMGTGCSRTNSTTLNSEAGIIPRFCHEIFVSSRKNCDTTSSVEISYFEIYNEKIHDLLASNSTCSTKRAPLKVREHPVYGPYIVDLSQHTVQTYDDLQSWLQVGNSQRATAATGMNEKSSRSHSIFSIILTQTPKGCTSERKTVEPSRRSKINLVDLAGSERLSQTCASGDRLREGVSINKSLLILGKVIASLAESTNNRKRGFVPYRESVLTWLLKESLGGNSRTAMLGTVSPGNIHMEETLATLRYASQARAIVNRVRINEDPHDKLIRELKAEVLRLRGVREGYERQLGAPLRSILSVEGSSNDYIEEADKKQREIELLRDKLKQAEEQLSLTQKSWSEKLHEAEARKDKELKFLRCCGIAVEIDFRNKGTQPCLVNLAADPMLSGALLYLIPPGRVRIGNLKDNRKERSRNGLDIVLDGPLVRQLHCTIENNNGRLTLSPEHNADTYLNGQIVNGKVLLKHGDRLVIGGNHYFKVCNPHDDQSNKQTTAQPVDFEFAHQEILTIQEEKLRAELEESKRKAIKELENAKREIEAQLGAQKCSFEREIQVLGTTLEKQKIALETTNQRKRELEIEKDLLAHEVERNNLMRKILPDDTRIQVTLYKSNFLQELEGILFETTADVETALQIKLSDEAIKTGGVSLHEMQLLVREATERCRDVGVNYEFDQQQMIVDRSLQPCVRVRDRDRMLETHWQPMNFLDWIHRLRDHEIEDSIRELRNRDDHWEPWEDSEIVEDSLNNSRISINMTPVKRRLNESFHQLSDNSMIEGTVVNETTELTLEKRREDIVKCLEEMENAAKTLSRLCHQYESRETSGHVTTSLDKVRGIIDNLKHTLDGKTHKVSKDKDGISSHSFLDNTVIGNAESGVSETNSNERNLPPDLRNSPSKLGIRDKCQFFKDLPNFKSVRFDVE